MRGRWSAARGLKKELRCDSMAQQAPFLLDLSIPGMPGSYELHIGERALRFSDKEEQNMRIIPKSSVCGITIRDTDRVFSTTDVPKALAATTFGGSLGAWLVRRSMYGLIHSKGGLDLCSVLGGGFGLFLGWRFGHWAFRKQHTVDGSFVQLHTAGQVTGFNCSDLKAQELVRRLL